MSGFCEDITTGVTSLGHMTSKLYSFVLCVAGVCEDITTGVTSLDHKGRKLFVSFKDS